MPRNPYLITLFFLLFFSCDTLPATEGNKPGTDPPGAESEKLLWPAPAFSETVQIPFIDQQQRIVLDDDIDYRIVLPDQPLTHRLDIVGGRNIVIVGGAFRLKGYTDTETNRAALAFWYNDDNRRLLRTIHVEGIHFDMTEARDRDAIALNDEFATFQIQNIRFFNVNGDHLGLHPDAIENWGGAKRVRIYKATVVTDHQGFLLSPLQPTQTRPIEHVDIRKVDFRRNAGVYGSYPNHKCPIFLWLVHYRQETCVTYNAGAYLSEVYALHPENCWDFGMNTAMPNTLQPAGCLAQVSTDSTELTWPTLSITGSVKQGTPPKGEFVPNGLAGVNYVSPGYRTGS